MEWYLLRYWILQYKYTLKINSEKIYRLSEFEQGDFYFLSNKIVLNQATRQKVFSECFIRQVNFLNYIFNWTSFPYTKCKNLTFEDFILQNANSKKSELENYIFKNCQLTTSYFARSNLTNFDFIIVNWTMYISVRENWWILNLIIANYKIFSFQQVY